MYRNYLKLLFRNFGKNKLYALINIGGLSIGLCCSLFIYLYVGNEFSFDTYHPDHEYIYRLDGTFKFGEQSTTAAYSSWMVKKELLERFPETAAGTRLLTGGGNQTVRMDDNVFTEKGDSFLFADVDFFKVFGVALIEGNLETVLENANSMVITQRTATKIFGQEDPIGKSVEVFNSSGTERYIITGICENVADNTHIQFDYLPSVRTYIKDFPITALETRWFTDVSFRTYIKLVPGTSIEQYKSKFDILNKEKTKELGFELSYVFTPVSDIYFSPPILGEVGPKGDKQSLYILSAIGALILSLASFNFINLTTARFTIRAREIGLRKVMGSSRGQLTFQFLNESVAYVVLSLMMAISLMLLLLPTFNNFTDKNFRIGDVLSLENCLLFLVFGVFLGFISGLYPSLVMARFKIIPSLRGESVSKNGMIGVREILVILQIAVSFSLIAGSMLFKDQFDYLFNKDLGFQSEGIIYLERGFRDEENYPVEAFKDELLRIPNIKQVTNTNALPGLWSGSDNFAFMPEGGEFTAFAGSSILVNYNYIETLGIDVLLGRSFSKDFGTDQSAVLVNETAAKKMGWENPIGKKIYLDPNQEDEYTIIGMIRDFHTRSFHEEIGPVYVFLNPRGIYITLKVDSRQFPMAINSIRKVWEKYSPNEAFNFTELTSQFEMQHSADFVLIKMVDAFSMVTLAIACLGLFGISEFSAQKRTKEIAIRKVLGASIKKILWLTSKGFIAFVGIASVVSIPLVLIGTNKWLQDFAFKAAISPWPFIRATLVMLFIGLLTIGYHAIAGALANPSHSLRTE